MEPTEPEKAAKAPSVTTGAILATLRTMRQLFVLVIGLTVVLIGVAMILLPGPGLLTIIVGLMFLGLEFAWARRWMAKFRSYLPKRKPNAAPTAAPLPLQSPSPSESGPSAPLSSSAETP
jgi:Putative transmembrane protein (PGPGW)